MTADKGEGAPEQKQTPNKVCVGSKKTNLQPWNNLWKAEIDRFEFLMLCK